jgi:hypothetical protein
VASLRVRGSTSVLAVALLVLGPTIVGAADPAPQPTVAATAASGGSCDDRFPEDGPAGLDLRLGCVVSEVVGLYTARQTSTTPPTLSAYAFVLVAALVGALGAVAIATRLVRRAAGRRLAPVLPDEWWQCPACRSVNPTKVQRCYSCGGPVGTGPTLLTDDVPATPQTFGRGKHG